MVHGLALPVQGLLPLAAWTELSWGLSSGHTGSHQAPPWVEEEPDSAGLVPRSLASPLCLELPIQQGGERERLLLPQGAAFRETHFRVRCLPCVA